MQRVRAYSHESNISASSSRWQRSETKKAANTGKKLHTRHTDMVRQVLAVDEEDPTPVHRLAYACAEDPAHAPPPTLLEETLLEEDRAATDRRRASLKLGPFERDGLGLAFSGGGVRAASFQSGVLWRMAELNGQSVPDAPAVRESGAARPRPGRGAPRAARGGACRSDQTKIEPRGGTHYTEARGGVGVRELPVAIITVLTRITF